MSRFVEGEDRRQPALLPSCLEDYVSEDNPARVIDVFVDELDLASLGGDEDLSLAAFTSGLAGSGTEFLHGLSQIQTVP
jgi:hypothetical protein